MQNADHLVERVEEAVHLGSHLVVEMDCFGSLKFITLVIDVVNHGFLVKLDRLLHKLLSTFVDEIEDPVGFHCFIAFTLSCRTGCSLNCENVLVLLFSADLFRQLSLKCTEDVIKVGDNHESKEVLGDFKCPGFD